MSWLELDDGILDHPKFIRAVKLGGGDAVHLWLGLRAYCGKQLTDGFVPEDMLDEVRGPTPGKRRAAALAALRQARLIDEAEGGVQLHNYLKWSKSRDWVLKQREAARERQAKFRGGHGGSNGVTPALVTLPSPSPSPSPNPTPTPHPPGAPEVGSLESRAKRWVEDPNRAAFECPQPERWPEILSLQVRLAEVFGLPVEKPRQPRDPRCWVPLQRYAEGHSEAELLDAIEGAKQSKAIGDSREYQVLATILRDSAQVDKLRALHRPSGTLRKAPSVAARIAADEAKVAADRAARGLPPAGDDRDAVRDPAAIARILEGIG